MQFNLSAQTEPALMQLAAKLAQLIETNTLIRLNGGLGAGKTTFARGILRAFGYEGAVKSPTFTLVEPYALQWGQVYHFDLYRLNDPGELMYLGVEDYLRDGRLCLVEWPEKAEGLLPQGDLSIALSGTGEERDIVIRATSDSGKDICHKLHEVHQP